MLAEIATGSNVKQAVPFFNVTNIEASLRGYRLDFESPTEVPESTVYSDVLES